MKGTRLREILEKIIEVPNYFVDIGYFLLIIALIMTNTSVKIRKTTQSIFDTDGDRVEIMTIIGQQDLDKWL